MAEMTVSYHGATVLRTGASGTWDMKTEGKVMEGDVSISLNADGGLSVEPLSVTANGSYTAPAGTAYSPVTVNVAGGEVSLQSKSVTPTESQQTVTPDSGYDGLSSVTVGAIGSGYVGSGVTRRSSGDLTASGATVTAPAGYYAQSASKSVATAAQATPSISVSAGGLVTASAAQSAGYVAAGTKSATYQLPLYDGSVQAG